jgi:hypothetical protein
VFEYSFDVYFTTATSSLRRFGDFTNSGFVPSDGTAGGVIRQFSEALAVVHFGALEYMPMWLRFGGKQIAQILGQKSVLDDKAVEIRRQLDKGVGYKCKTCQPGSLALAGRTPGRLQDLVRPKCIESFAER